MNVLPLLARDLFHGFVEETRLGNVALDDLVGGAEISCPFLERCAALEEHPWSRLRARLRTFADGSDGFVEFVVPAVALVILVDADGAGANKGAWDDMMLLGVRSLLLHPHLDGWA
ncbi:hypothetical protein NM208_g8357 [Fusarium decemcellulare]|uniref:Uncharacterized protein n=1 Tax=Fusarium decemcellulare TaxID=57161 RepID=A0ACC1S5L9_9HYPO|nr:hypothetical protein NM208_g8357 [Fusarium decemcellulare]